MSFSEYLIDSLVGILVVFFALILLMVIIKIVTYVTDKQEARAAAKTASKAQPVVQETETKSVQYAKGTAGDLNLYDTDPKDAAMIMAIIADETKTPLNELRFISIREVKE